MCNKSLSTHEEQYKCPATFVETIRYSGTHQLEKPWFYGPALNFKLLWLRQLFVAQNITKEKINRVTARHIIRSLKIFFWFKYYYSIWKTIYVVSKFVQNSSPDLTYCLCFLRRTRNSWFPQCCSALCASLREPCLANK